MTLTPDDLEALTGRLLVAQKRQQKRLDVTRNDG